MSRSGRDDALVYGRNPVREALRGRRRVREMLVSARARASLPELEASAVPLRVVAPPVLDELAGSPDHQGVVARVDPYPYVDADALVAGERPLVVALDEITDPQNLGAIARSVEGAGASGLVIPRHRSAQVTAAVCKASAGAVEHLAIGIVPNLADWLVAVKRGRVWCYGAAADGPRAYTEADLADGCVLVIGAEGRGIRPRVAKSCDELVRIPLAGRIGSLNASVAAALLVFEAVRQRSLASERST
jgi:23S rRNA (guanosine2251-2'-O)-methyltransferase